MGSPEGSAHQTGSPTFREHNKKAGQEKARGSVQKNGWTQPALRGGKLPVSVGFWMETVTTANVRKGGIVLMAFSEPHGWFPVTKSVPGTKECNHGC